MKKQDIRNPFNGCKSLDDEDIERVMDDYIRENPTPEVLASFQKLLDAWKSDIVTTA